MTRNQCVKLLKQRDRLSVDLKCFALVTTKRVGVGIRDCVRIIGIDPGLRATGWGVIEAKGSTYVYVASGVIRTKPQALADRLHTIHGKLTDVVLRFQPESAAVEKTFVSSGRASSLDLGHARAIALLVPVQTGVDVHEYAPNTIKRAVVGRGHATKEQVNYMVRMQLTNFQDLGEDSTDALAIALTHSSYARHIASDGGTIVKTGTQQ